MSSLAQTTVLGLLVYELTGSELYLGLLGLAEFAPAALLVVVVGALESLWSRHEQQIYEIGPEPSMSVRRAALRTHEKLVEAIEAGDETTAVALARNHLEATQTYTRGRNELSGVNAELVRGGGGPESVGQLL